MFGSFKKIRLKVPKVDKRADILKFSSRNKIIQTYYAQFKKSFKKCGQFSDILQEQFTSLEAALLATVQYFKNTKHGQPEIVNISQNPPQI